MIHLRVTVSNPAELLDAAAYGAGALLRWESAAAEAGPYVEGGTVALVATTTMYDIWDPAGTTGTWYRTRISNAAGDVVSAYSDAFQGGIPTKYAELEDALALFETQPKPSRQARLEKALVTATEELTKELGGRDYFRHPAVSTEDATNVFYADGNGTDTLCIHQGLVTLSKLEVSWDWGQTFTEITSDNYWLLGDDPYSSAPIPTGEPYFHIKLPVFASPYPVFPVGPRTVRLTGAYGWPSIPSALTEACAERARQIVYADPSFQGSVPSDPEYGIPSVTARWPHVFYRFLERERSRFFCRL